MNHRILSIFSFCVLAFVGPLHGQQAARVNDPRLVHASRDYVGENYQAFASRVAGKTAGAATINIFSAGNLTAGTGYVRNTALWCQDVDLTCFSPWNSTENNLQGGCLVSPKHVLLTNHFSGPSGGSNPMTPGVTTIKFVARDNTIYTRTITALTRVGTTDLLVGTLDGELPAAIRPAKLLPANLGSFSGTALPLLTTDQQKRARIKLADSTALASNLTFWTAAASGAPFSAWTTGAPASGDSGSINGFILGGEFYLAFLSHGTDIGGNLVGDWVSVQLPAVNTVLGSQYALIVPDFTTTRDASAIRQGEPGYFSEVGADLYHLPPGTIVADDTTEPQGNIIFTTNASGAFDPISPAPGQSVRTKSDGTGWEAYTPSTGAVSSVNGQTGAVTGAQTVAGAAINPASIGATTPGPLSCTTFAATSSTGNSLAVLDTPYPYQGTTVLTSATSGATLKFVASDRSALVGTNSSGDGFGVANGHFEVSNVNAQIAFRGYNNASTYGKLMATGAGAFELNNGTPGVGASLALGGTTLLPQSSAPAAPASGVSLYVDTSGDLHALHANGTDHTLSAH